MLLNSPRPCCPLRILTALALIAGFVCLCVTNAHAQATLIREQTNSAHNATTLSLTFLSPVPRADTVVVIVAYTKAKNAGQVRVSGMGGTWTRGYGPSVQSQLGLVFIYGNQFAQGQSTLHISVPIADNLSALAEDWSGLNAVEDPGSQSSSFG